MQNGFRREFEKPSMEMTITVLKTMA